MEPIKETLKRVINAPAFSERYDEMKKEILANEDVQVFLGENSAEMTNDIVNRGLGKLYEFISQKHDCHECASVATCHNIIKGHLPKLTLERRNIGVTYVACKQKIVEDEHKAAAARITSMHMPKDVLKARLNSFHFDDNSRVDIVALADAFIEEVRTTGQLPAKGLYIFGEFGVGKSYFLGALANELAELKIQSLLVYVPEFLREMKQAIQEQSLAEKIDFVKKAPVLMLDDLGAEALSSWTRDEILGTILHFRMAENLPTFITSNFDYKELEEHLAYSSKGDREPVKAGRMMERIRSITVPVKLNGKNRRV